MPCSRVHLSAPRASSAKRLAWFAPLVAVLSLVGGCGNNDVATQDTSQSGDVDVVDPDTSIAADSDGGGQVDAGWKPACPGGLDCTCADPTDCDAPLCLETAIGRRCSAYCGDGVCAPGWACEGKTAGADATYFCIPAGGLVCRPCIADAECQAAGHAGARCVDYGDAGGFCGVSCKTDANCPEDRVCREVGGVQGGGASKQCVVPGASAKVLGTCPCSPFARAQELSTTCWQVNGVGADAKRCKGVRSCGAAGLGTCALLTGAAAVCQQAQCLDPLTLTPLADGVPCDDGRGCTQGDVCSAGVCVAGTQTCPCEPGILDCPAPSPTEASNKCKGTLYCQAQAADASTPYACSPNPGLTKVCDDSLDGACVKNACVPLSGECTPTLVERTTELCDLPSGAGGKPACRLEVKAADLPDNAAAACDDGLACSTGDACAGGGCAAADQSGCKCKADADCVDDGDLCNGTPFCDKSGPEWGCKVNPSTIVSCDTSGDGGCLQTGCEAKTGVCLKDSKPAGSACDDGVACTVGDVCTSAGICEPGTWTCCKSDVDCAGEEDGDLCNGTLFCDKAVGACKLNAATVVTCPSAGDTACAKSSCVTASGQCALQPVNEGKGCDDGHACTTGEVCALGQCQGGTDICPCSIDADCAAKDDGDVCNGTLYCNKALGQCKVNPKTVVVCPTVDDTDCKVNTCIKATGKCAMQPLPSKALCDFDGTACTAGDACDGLGTCAAGTAVCACVSDADCAGKDDGDLCNGVLYCDKSGQFADSPRCKVNPATVKSCPSVDDTACSKNQCQAKTGLCAFVVLAAGAPCDDGEACAGNDGCDGKGKCQAGTAQSCGCKVDGDCAAFDDGDVCNGGYGCKAGACVFDAKVLICDDNNACTEDSCDKVKGCLAVGLPGCATCAGDKDCGDGNVCTFDFCLVGTCKWPAAQGSCQDGDACTEGDVCADGACKAGTAKVCDDNNPCTDDACEAQSSCTTVNNTAPCDADSSICTENDACAAGACKAGGPKTCDDDDPCTEDGCDTKSGCSKSYNTAACDADGSLCTKGDACLAGTCQAGPVLACDDDNPCTVDKCDANTGCLHAPAADNTECPVGFCKAGACWSPVVSVAAGWDHTCALKQDGTVFCWGSNAQGQLGDGSVINQGAAVAVKGVQGATAIAAGKFHSCALMLDSSVWCWGANYAGQLGNGGAKAPVAPAKVKDLAGVKGITAGDSHTCALKQDSSVVCWGQNSEGELGNGSMTGQNNVWTPVKDLQGVILVVAGSAHTCALRLNGEVACWGRNYFGQLGDGGTVNKGEPVKVTGLQGAKGLMTGSQHTCVLKQDGSLMCWGSNGKGALGDGSTANAGTPVTVKGLQGVATIAGGYEYSCAHKLDGSVDCWGFNNFGQLGDGSLSDKGAPAAVKGLTGTQSIAAGFSHTCAVKLDGSVVCWGRNNQGQLGFGDPGSKSVPTPVAGAKAVNDVSTAHYHACAVLQNGSVNCWGSNDYGELGNGGTTSTNIPTAVKGLLDAKAIAAGPYHSCALRLDGSAVCWGYNFGGQLGNGKSGLKDTESAPVAVIGLKGATAIAAGYGHTCALGPAGKVFCWGFNKVGQLGNGSAGPAANTSMPGEVAGLTDATAIAAGWDLNCALKSGGSVVCWGFNNYGQLGDGTTVNNSYPVVVKGLEKATAIAVVGNHSCAAKQDGSVACWGYNGNGELGDGTVKLQSTLVAVKDLKGGTAVAAGNDYSCALKVEGDVACWGNNRYGQLGDGTTTSHAAPGAVVGLQDATAIRARGGYACAVKKDASVMCWGDNGRGQIGDGSAWKATAVPVKGL